MVRKRQQIDNLNELPKEKRPTDLLIWWGDPEEIEEWLDKVFKRNEKENDVMIFSTDEIERDE